MTKITCDQCGQDVCPSRGVTLGHLCTPSGIMMAKDWDFCSSECFWKWTEARKPKQPPEDYRLMQCRRCEGQGWNQGEGTCTLCKGSGFIPFSIGQPTGEVPSQTPEGPGAPSK